MGNRLFWVNQAIFYRAKTHVEAMQTEKASEKSLFIEAKMPPDSFRSTTMHPLKQLS